MATIQETNLIADALEKHSYNDWYVALLHATLLQSKGSIADSIKVADAAYSQVSEDPTNTTNMDERTE